MHKPMIRSGKHKLKRVFTMDEVVDEILKRVLDKHHLLNVKSKKEVYVVTTRELRELIKEIAGIELRPSYHVQRYLDEGLRKRGYRIIMKRRNNKFVKFIIAKDGAEIEGLNVG